MARKRDFVVDLARKGKKITTFVGKGCVVKEKSVAAKLQIENPYKETVDCESFVLKKKIRTRRKA